MASRKQKTTTKPKQAPTEEEKFEFQNEKANIEELANNVISEIFNGKTYEKEEGQNMAKEASTAILEQLANKYPNVKFNVLTAIAQKGESSLHMDMESLIEVGKDGTTTVKAEGDGFTTLVYVSGLPTQ